MFFFVDLQRLTCRSALYLGKSQLTLIKQVEAHSYRKQLNIEYSIGPEDHPGARLLPG
jgi:hypothetical protein